MRTVRIPLHSRKYPNLFAIVDEADAELVSQFRWHPSHLGKGVYAIAKVGKTTLYMHRVITGAKRGQYVDHINHDTLDNRRSNLRAVRGGQNQQNRTGPRRDNTIGYVGVYRDGKRWRAEVWDNGKKIAVKGSFPTPEDAARARDRAAWPIYGEHAFYNFPEEVKE